MGNAWRPRTWHRYGYAFASPISYYDAYGLQVPPVTPVPAPTPPPYTPVPWPTPTANPCPSPAATAIPAPQPVPTPPRMPTPTPTPLWIHPSQPMPSGASRCPSGPLTRWPDYWMFNIAVGYAFGGVLGAGGSATVDRYGRLYGALAPLSLGEGLPTSAILGLPPIPISFNLSTTTVLGLQVGPQPHLKARSEHWSGGLAPLRSRSCGEGQARSTIYGCSISGGWVCQEETPGREELQGFLTGWASNVNIGAGAGFGVVESATRGNRPSSWSLLAPNRRLDYLWFVYRGFINPLSASPIDSYSTILNRSYAVEAKSNPFNGHIWGC